MKQYTEMTEREALEELNNLSTGIRYLMIPQWEYHLFIALDYYGPIRQTALVNKVVGISYKVMNDYLNKWERDGLVDRIAYNEIPPKVEYQLTARGKALIPMTMGMVAWFLRYGNEVLQCQREYDNKEKEGA